MDKIKNQLAGVAALLGVIAAIGGGFVKYGEITTKLDALASQESTDFSAQIAVLEEKMSDCM
jgi:outer membrane murein-binding lipoprotein Lpp